MNWSSAARDAGAKVVLVGDQAQLSSIDAGGTFAALVRTATARPRNSATCAGSITTGRSGPASSCGRVRSMPSTPTTPTTASRSGDREQMLDALYAAWKDDIEAGLTSLMIAGDLGTVSELNARARADRFAAGEVTEGGVGSRAVGRPGSVTRCVTRQNDRRLASGRRWVRNGDRWTVTATHHDGSMTVKRANGGGYVDLPADYVAEHVELAYASTAHRAQGRTVDTAHAVVSPTTTREVLYVSGTRGARATGSTWTPTTTPTRRPPTTKQRAGDGQRCWPGCCATRAPMWRPTR